MRIMILDDEIIAIKMLEKLVSQYEDLTIVKTITNPGDLFTEIETAKPNLIFIDINLGGVSGVELAEKILEKHPNIKIVFVTAYSEYAVRAFELNAVDYLLKPVSKKRFDKMVTRILSDSNLSKVSSRDTLNMTVFLDAQIRKNDGSLLKFRTRKAMELVFLLWVHEKRGLSKDELMDALWPEQPVDASTMMLHTTIYQIRQTFKKEFDINPIKYKSGKYFLNINHTSDLEQLQRILKNEPNKDNVNKVLELYQGLMFERNDYRWSNNISEVFHHEVIEFIINAIEKGTVSLSDYHRTMAVFEEDILSTEQYVELICQHLEKIEENKQARILKERAYEYWEKELGVAKK